MAYRFAEKGWQVLATTRHPERLKENTENMYVLAADITQPDGRANVLDYVQKHWNNELDCLVNNVGFGLAGPLEMLTEEQIRRQIEVNFFAPLLLTKILLPSLRAVKGRIINLSSLLGFAGMPLHSLYASSKFALEGWSESLHYELVPHGVQVTLVEPGGFRTGFAQHMEWPLETAAGTPLYKQQLNGFRDFFTRLSQHGKGKNPAHVADIVIKLASQQTMPLRIRVGTDAHALYYLRRILPQRVADMLLRGISKRLMRV
jgi:NAD(P)-dependent dehydrogenase (short-subunit alcohol dehydrogenase family)